MSYDRYGFTIECKEWTIDVQWSEIDGMFSSLNIAGINRKRAQKKSSIKVQADESSQ